MLSLIIGNNNTNLYLNLKEQYDKTQKYNNDPRNWFRENWGLNWSLESSYDDYENKIRKIYEILIRKEKLKQLETI